METVKIKNNPLGTEKISAILLIASTCLDTISSIFSIIKKLVATSGLLFEIETNLSLYCNGHGPSTAVLFLNFILFLFPFFKKTFIYFSWRLITLQYYSDFCHTFT